MSDNSDHVLVMPFVTVASRGGPHEDHAFCAGWQMGGISVLLQLGQMPIYEVTIRTDCVPQADLIAMDRGYTLDTMASDVAGWTFARFTKVAPLAEVLS